MYAGIWTGCTMFLAGCLSVGPIAVGFLCRRLGKGAQGGHVEAAGADAPREDASTPELVGEETKPVAPQHIETAAGPVGARST